MIEKLKAELVKKIPKENVLSHTYNGVVEKQKNEIVLRTKPIAWGIPMDELMFSKFFSNFFRLGYMVWDSIFITESTYLPEARNIIHKTFLQTNLDYLLMLDSDVLPPPQTAMKLIEHNKHIVCGWYNTKGKKSHPCVYDFVKRDEEGIDHYIARKEAGKGLEKVDGVGAGCVLMSREAARAIGEKPYDMNRGGEDLALCTKLREAGFEIYVDWDIACAHFGVFYV